jgi:hypothetical protein
MNTSNDIDRFDALIDLGRTLIPFRADNESRAKQNKMGESVSCST